MTDIQRMTVRLTPDEALDPERSLRAHLPANVADYRIVRRGVDARQRLVKVQFTVDVSESGPLAPVVLEPPAPPRPNGHRVIVVGAGPAGLMAAYALVQKGVSPIVLDRGAAFPGRHRQAKALRLWGQLDGAPPLTCGLGGAGTYSDGKLMTRRNSKETRQALGLMAHFGCAPQLLVETHPHVGSNRLPALVDGLRGFLEGAGARFFFDTEVTGLARRGGRVSGVTIHTGEEVDGEAVVLAAGNSARPLLRRLLEGGVAMAAKGFAMGVRVEHQRAWVDEAQYGSFSGHPALGAARYALAFSDLPRAVYSFCMCPGGHLLATPPEPDHLAVNGMSFEKRSSRWSNAALVAATGPEDWARLDPSPLGGISWQKVVESRCFAVTGDYRAPAQRLTDFIAGQLSTSLPDSSYRPGLVSHRIDLLLPDVVVAALRTGFARAQAKMPGYVQEEALLVAPETLTSTPLRILRNELLQSPSLPGLFPCGEGSGWSGGITSSAADGLRVGEMAAGWVVGNL